MANVAPQRPNFLNKMTPAEQARIAVMRFGLGPRRDQDASLWATPCAAYDQCLKELDAPAAATINSIDLDPAGENYKLLLSPAEAGPLANGQRAVGTNFDQELRARYAKHMLCRVGFVERLAMFWLNHFNMSLASPTVTAYAGLVERQVIRANTLGKFETMLLGVCQSIPMLTYLNGRNSTRTNTNQNFAREILELHTVGTSCEYSANREVDKVRNYEQRDVEALAKVLTGWSVAHNASDAQKYSVPSALIANPLAGIHTFVPQLHAPGPQTVLGKTYAQAGVDQGIAVLKDLANHPLTAQHIAREMLCHFVTDTPSDAAVKTLSDTFIATKGNLKEVARALLNLEEAWTTPLNRLRQPYPWFISMMRALNIPHLALTNVAAGDAVTFQDCIEGYLQTLGQKPWSWRTPDGFPNRNSYWMNGDALRLRANVAYHFLSRMKAFPMGKGTMIITTRDGVPDGSKIQDGTLIKPVAQTRSFQWTMPLAVNLVQNVFGNTLSTATSARVVEQAKTDNVLALALLFSSPEYLLA
ncbi:DUF1800 domain-containing protein [Aestuariivirga sp.]|uniref:DUF1800 domain-containing protein n=1 Tax=Aestuariivirga sp. TaxID=2650926 RepID=UPI003BAC5EFC